MCKKPVIDIPEENFNQNDNKEKTFSYKLENNK